MPDCGLLCSNACFIAPEGWLAGVVMSDFSMLV